MMKLIPTNHLIVRDWKENVVYLVHFPRTHAIPSTCPFALKLETWIRMNGLVYQVNLRFEFKRFSIALSMNNELLYKQSDFQINVFKKLPFQCFNVP